jgi:hypothetical protein
MTIDLLEPGASNPFGAGSPFKSDGINNPFSPYGSPFSNQSATNPFATDAPRLYDPQGNYRGKLSANLVGLSGFSGLFSLSGYLVSLVVRSANPMNETNQINLFSFRPTRQTK